MYNGINLTLETILKTRIHFYNLCLGCIKEAHENKSVNNIEEYVKYEMTQSKEYLEGKYDNTFTFLQRAYYLQTGESIPIFSEGKESNISKEEANKEKKRLNDIVDKLSKTLNRYQKNAQGLVSDSIRNTEQYKHDKAEYDKAFKQLQTFNKWYVKEFRKK